MLIEKQPLALSRHNNFDLIRLLAAYQVVAMHVGEHMKIAVPNVLTFFPGVWIFFIVSGFLITASLAHCNSVGEYLRNRVLRIYPGLWAMTLVTVLLLIAFGQINAGTPKLWLLAYVLGQGTVFQPVDGGLGLFRHWGTGSVNGVLWTLTTELQFYVCLPLIFWLSNRFPRWRLRFLWILLAASLVLYEFELRPWTDPNFVRTVWPGKLLTLLYISIPTHLFGFLIGTICYLQLPRIFRFVEGKFLYWALAYAVFVLLVWKGLGLAGWNLEKNPACMLTQRLLLAGLIFSLAYSLPGLAHALLRGNDVSYGVYVYHMLVVNSLLQLGLFGAWPYGVTVVLVTGIVALCSWRWVERPALRLKRRRPRPGGATSSAPSPLEQKPATPN
jgi:peptidoglycan/LPS O-acetylase OafA/YrhL